MPTIGSLLEHFAEHVAKSAPETVPHIFNALTAYRQSYPELMRRPLPDMEAEFAAAEAAALARIKGEP